MKKKISSLNQQLKDFLSTMGISIKHASLLLIAFMSLVLTVLDLNGFDFGVIALVCWVFAFLDLARIKFKDCEIDFMNHKQTLTADERKLFLDNYNLVNNFIFEVLKCGHVNKEALDNIQEAFANANLMLPKEIVDYTQMWAENARDAFILHCRWEELPVGDKRSELIDEEFKIVKEILEMKPAEIYRNHIKVGETADE